jgi:hypothetical protein
MKKQKRQKRAKAKAKQNRMIRNGNITKPDKSYSQPPHF